ncbi:DNA endonuclease SmrA [Tatumella citrea]|uniref:Smr domain-containing protein n=1 Tax=Tatumella citrea TaxID=53336 RepID=A0A1Y0L7R0_TATCI|nr:DNA endonuclease SmrA [Tatumella citrea]ARU94071.1 hypothetical protein A7K98_09970 [Tatumella citrea]ARU98109.1 hypothetical protein A7K99_09970 [Tatumella citrea]
MTNPDDHTLFSLAVNDVNPIKNNQKIHIPRSVNKVLPRSETINTNFLLKDRITPLSLMTPATFRAEGLQTGVVDKLRRGAYSLDGSLFLIRQSVEQARQSVYEFMTEIIRRGGRNVLIIHGKSREETSHSNIIRSYLTHWLPQFSQVQAFCVAHQRHGGSGAMYVSLRKPEELREQNRELHGGRSR